MVIDLDKTFFIYRGQCVEGDVLAKLLGLDVVGEVRETSKCTKCGSPFPGKNIWLDAAPKCHDCCEKERAA